MAKARKVNPKDVAKMEVMGAISAFLEEQGYDVTEDGRGEYGFTMGTIVVHHDICDIQLKPITPSAKVGDKYPLVVDED